MRWSRETLLGLVLIVGSSVMLFAMMQQVNTRNTEEQVQTDTLDNETTKDTANTGQPPLTADVETELRILAQKKQERMQRVAEQEKRTQHFLREQQQAQTLALEKARSESEQYRNNTIEPVPQSDTLNKLVTQNDKPDTEKNVAQITKPVVTSRHVESNTTQRSETVEQDQKGTSNTDDTIAVASTAPTQAFAYTVKSGDGLIKLSRRYNVPVQALALANNMTPQSQVRVGQIIEIPSRIQSERLLREFNASSNTSNVNNNTNNSNTNNNANANRSENDATAASTDQPEQISNNTAPNSNSALKYSVASGDGLIKLSRQYNVPIDVLAQANGMSTNQSLRVGQTLTIPAQSDIARLQREAADKRRRQQAAKDADQRLAEARKQASLGEATGKYGVQVALADDQARADNLANKMRAAGYEVTTSPTSRGVRVIIGPEIGKDAALALKDKINADNNTGINNAWVLTWR